MSMFCFQCQETAKNQGCTVKGICGKDEKVSNLQDLLLYNLKGISEIIHTGKNYNIHLNGLGDRVNKFITESLFATITNANFNEHYFIKKIIESFKIKSNVLQLIANQVKENTGADIHDELHPASLLEYLDPDQFQEEAKKVGVLSTENEDIRSLRELLIYGIKGIAAYYHHANMLNYFDVSIDDFIKEGLVSTLIDKKSVEELISIVLKCGEFGVKAMAILDKANTESYGNPEPTKVNIGVGTNPGILISGHDLKDMEELLKQTENSGIDVYTHGEMLPANYYPKFKHYTHFKGNYGGSWWKQHDEFEKFNGPILMTTNCLVKPKDSYINRIFTTGVAGFEGGVHIPDREKGKEKDFSKIIDLAKTCSPPIEIENGTIIGGFAHNYVLSIADKILEAVKSGSIKKFVVMAGCDGRYKARDYYTDFAKELPEDTIILTAGCAKYRYNKLKLKDIGGIPRILDAGQCNDSYSLTVIALKLAAVLKVNINDLPIVYNIAWYEQKAVIVLLSLLYLGIKNIHLGPSLPAFLSPNVVNVLIEKFNINGINDVTSDIETLIG